ncbi:MAG: amino acid permease [Rickettsiaceae bacterium]
MNNAPSNQLSLFGFLMITSSMVVSLYTYPTFATSGFAAVFFLFAAGFLWFIPVCLVAAELGTGGNGWSDSGVFSWGKAAFGPRWGFCMIFSQWFEILLGFIPMLYFVSNGLGYTFDIADFQNPTLIQLILTLVIFWGITFANFFGTKVTKFIATYSFFIGIVFPMIVLIILGILYILDGNSIQIKFTESKFFPNFSTITSLVVLVSFVLSYMGAEASAVHVNSLKNPGRDYPLATLILVIMTIIIGSSTSLTIAMIIPHDKISLSAGIFEAFKFLFEYHNIMWLFYPFAFIVSISAIGKISSWINGPVNGMKSTAKLGIIPEYFAKINSHEMPVRLIVLQGAIVSFWLALVTSAGVLTHSEDMAFFTAMTLTVIIYLTMYMLLFASYIYLKITVPHSVNPRKFNMPSSVGISLSAIGLLSTFIAFCVSFARPSTVKKEVYTDYLVALIVCYVITMIIPHVIYSISKFHKQKS